MKHYPTFLSIAGSDSIGGAGIQADIKTATALGVYAMTVVTAVTTQNTRGVAGVMPVPADVIRAQLSAVLCDVRPDAVKIGMVPNTEASEVIGEAIGRRGLTNVVVDPVMVATSGDDLVEGSDEQLKMQYLNLMSGSTLATPNLPEAHRLLALLGSDEPGLDPNELTARLIRAYGPKALLLKGGHGEGRLLTDLLACPDPANPDADCCLRAFAHPRISTTNTHGTGCSLSSAIASMLALGYELTEAVGRGIGWLQQAIASGAGYELGRGHGPIDHMHNITSNRKKL